MREKSGVWNGSVLGFANGFDAGSVAGAVARALAGAAKAGWAAAVNATAADASRTERIISLLGDSITYAISGGRCSVLNGSVRSSHRSEHGVPIAIKLGSSNAIDLG